LVAVSVPPPVSVFDTESCCEPLSVVPEGPLSLELLHPRAATHVMTMSEGVKDRMKQQYTTHSARARAQREKTCAQTVPVIARSRRGSVGQCSSLMRERILLLASLLPLVGACGSSSDGTSDQPDTGVATDAGNDTGVAVDSPQETGPSGEVKGDVTRYDYTFDLTTAEATSKLSIDALTPGGDCFTVDDTNALADSPQWNGAPANSGTFDGSGRWTVCGSGVGPGALTVGASESVPESKYLLGLDIGFARSASLGSGTFSYLLSWIGGCSHFGPCDADPSKLVELHFDVTHPDGTTVLCPGVRTATSTKTTCEIKGTKAPTYSGFGIAADNAWVGTPFLHMDTPPLDVVIYESSVGKIGTTLDKTSMTEFFTWITGLFGPLPYGTEMRYGAGPTTWLGFEHPANVILYEKLPTLSTTGAYLNPTTHVFMHETVHQWAGDRTTIATAQDFAWKEATAEYVSYLFEDEHRPVGEAAASLSYWKHASLVAKHHLRPTDDPPVPVQNFYGDAYGPGPMIFYVQLESMLGRDVVIKAIQSFLGGSASKSADDLRLALEAASGKSLKPYFDAWVFGAGVPEWPSFSVKATPTTTGGDTLVTVTQKNASGTIYGCQIEVDVVGATKTVRATVDFGLAPTATTASATVTLGEAVVSTTLDPRNRVIAHDLGTTAIEHGPIKIWIL
jgi:aminopeptidase N